MVWEHLQEKETRDGDLVFYLVRVQIEETDAGKSMAKACTMERNEQ